MSDFFGENFMGRVGARLYADYAEKLPIIDYHCHLDPREIAEDRRFENIAGLWLGGDHYKWRAMRVAGVPEELITGGGDPYDKFLAWAGVLPRLIGCPLYSWSALELKRYFGFEKPLTVKTAPELWETANEKLKTFTAQEIVKFSGAEVICTTDDPADTLEYHDKLRDETAFAVYPTFRPDRAMNIESAGFLEYLPNLGDIRDLDGLKSALSRAMDRFGARGCRVSDHALEYLPSSGAAADEKAAGAALKRRLSGENVSAEDAENYRNFVLEFCAKEYARRDWAMQLHYGCLRSRNSAAFAKLGADTGFDMIGNRTSAADLARFLDNLGENLPKTVIYSLNPLDNAVIDSVLAVFQGGKTPYKIQHGAAWWFNDHRAGIVEHLTSLANFAALPGFVGMLTDSRSFVSYARHEYFRRILCAFLGGLVEKGEYPEDWDALGELASDISYRNARRYFGFKSAAER